MNEIVLPHDRIVIKQKSRFQIGSWAPDWPPIMYFSVVPEIEEWCAANRVKISKVRPIKKAIMVDWGVIDHPSLWGDFSIFIRNSKKAVLFKLFWG